MRLISERAARTVLHEVGVSDWSARRVLAAGLAGTPVWAGGAVLHDADRVAELASRQEVDWAEVDARCPCGLFVCKRPIALVDGRPPPLESLAPGWEVVSRWVRVAVSVGVERGDALPFLATTGGFVVLGADVVGVETERDGGRGAARLVLTPPGAWFSGFEARRLGTGPGRPWTVHAPHGLAGARVRRGRIPA